MTSADLFEGVLPVDKPVGPTSHDVVAVARRALHVRRIGHTGTLDPFASGLLLLCIGRATRLAEYLSASMKRYTATIRFGVTTDSDDLTGTVIDERDVSALRVADVQRALESQQGEILQVPPSYSAKKRDGRRAYELARRGDTVALDPVGVTIHELALMRWEPPFADIDVTCSAGTYIRAIARDAGAALGVGAHLTALRRTAIGRTPVDGALTLAELTDHARVRAALIPPLRALSGLPRVELGPADVARVRHGQRLWTDAGARGIAVLAAGDELIAIADIDDGMIRPRKVFL